MTHLTFAALIDYLEDRLDADERQQAETHLATCPACHKDLDVARKLLAGMREPDLAAPSSGLIRRAVAAFRRRQAQTSQRIRQKAQLRFDSWASAAAVGLRGSSRERQLLFSLTPFDIDLQFIRDNSKTNTVLHGQVLAHEPHSVELEGIEVRLTALDTDETRRALTDELGRFRLSDLREGMYTLALDLGDQDIVLDKLSIGD